MRFETLGGCLCGRVRYRYAGQPLAFYACHCTDCQRQTGSAFGLSMIANREEVEVLTVEPEGFEISMPDGRTKRGRYCQSCVARVWGEPVKFPQIFVLRPGTFDDPPGFAPFGDIWTASARSWVSFTEGPKFAGQPDSPLALVEAWQSLGTE
ncbi:MAG: GFA family protein [Myxococcota bacterium]